MTGKAPAIAYKVEAVFRNDESAAKAFACVLINATMNEVSFSHDMEDAYDTATVTASGMWTRNLANVIERLPTTLGPPALRDLPEAAVKLHRLSVQLWTRSREQAARLIELVLQAGGSNFTMEGPVKDPDYPETFIVQINDINPSDLAVVTDCFATSFPEN